MKCCVIKSRRENSNRNSKDPEACADFGLRLLGCVYVIVRKLHRYVTIAHAHSRKRGDIDETLCCSNIASYFKSLLKRYEGLDKYAFSVYDM